MQPSNIQYTVTRGLALAEHVTAAEDTHRPTRIPWRTGNAEWCCPFQHSSPSPCFRGADHRGGPQPLPLQFCRGVTLWDHPCDPTATVRLGCAGGWMKSRGRHPKHILPTPGLWHGANHTNMMDTVPALREVTPPPGPSGTALQEAMGQGCQGMIWPDLI